ncbi:SRPBCC family protein [Foetidibacter luteolus]|uniref:SRPBCC family protein n=1 Tax=Foetidibacter luteolus TaxID=2608880 RepID=UPI00129BB797|nr:SRPBCC domain-containing protein [Foetidibacter luteolus]
MNSEPFVIERVYNAPVSRVWKAITDKDQMKQWYFTLQEFILKVGFEFSFEAGKDNEAPYVHLCRITEVIKEKKLAYTWRYKDYEGESLVSFELFEEGENTRLKLTHTGLETFPKHPDFARESFSAGWTHIIGTSLKNYLQKA